MRVLHWSTLAVTLLLLLCEVTISQLCKSLITLVDGFHTLFVFVSSVLPPPPPPAGIVNPLLASVPASPPCASSFLALVGPPPGPQVATDGAAGASEAASRQPGCPGVPPPAGACGVSYPGSRVQPVGAFLSALLLASLCVSYLIQIVSFLLDPHPVQRPLVLVLVGAVGLTHKTLLLRLNWDQLLDEAVGGGGRPGTESHIEVNHKEIENSSQTSSALESSPDVESPLPGRRWPACPLWFLLVVRGLFTSSLALINSLLMFLTSPPDLHGAGTSGLLVYLDPALSLVAVIVLILTVRPQMCRYGLLLLQAAPPHVCVSELERRIAGVPGVQALHDLHIWQLAESLTVASVHVRCSAGLPANRFAELISGVTRELRHVGVSCCTVQPEFPPGPASAEACARDVSPGGRSEGLPPPPALQACSLACGKACAGSMCCSAHDPVAPPAGEARAEPQTLIIENTFL